MGNLTAGIPQWAFINAQIVLRASDSPVFRKATDEVALHDYRLPDYRFFNPAWIASLLYCLLVVPRELFVEGNERFWDSEVSPATMCSYFLIRIADPDLRQSSSKFLRKLRNAVAHARFEIDERMTFVFRDGQSSDDFVVEASTEKLMAFLSDIGAKLANLKNPSSLIQ